MIFDRIKMCWLEVIRWVNSDGSYPPCNYQLRSRCSEHISITRRTSHCFLAHPIRLFPIRALPLIFITVVEKFSSGEEHFGGVVSSFSCAFMILLVSPFCSVSSLGWVGHSLFLHFLLGCLLLIFSCYEETAREKLMGCLFWQVISWTNT